MKDGIKLIVGLGNPGPQYADTRHNAGAWLVEALARRFNVSLSIDSKHNALTGRTRIEGEDVRLLIPLTYMNVSGQAVAPFSNFYKIPAEQILVAHDELDLPPGTARFKQGGGHGGHNGLRDIISKLGNNRNFARLRIGIGHPGTASQVSGFVLSKAPSSEQSLIDQAVEEALTVLPTLIKGDTNKAMNRLHSFSAS